MELFKPEEFDIRFFDGKLTKYKHNAGYSKYVKNDSFAEVAKDLNNRLFLKNEKVLELGCAKGFLVEELRALGVNAYGLDLSEYALNEADNSIKDFLIKGDVLQVLKDVSDKEWDLIISSAFLECFSDNELSLLIPQMNRISKKQFHFVNDYNPEYYNSKSLSEWEIMGFSSGTYLQYINKIINIL